MELNSVATEGLNLCGDSARVGDRSFRNLVQITMDILLKRKSEDGLKSEYFDYSSYISTVVICMLKLFDDFVRLLDTVMSSA